LEDDETVQSLPGVRYVSLYLSESLGNKRDEYLKLKRRKFYKVRVVVVVVGVVVVVFSCSGF